MQKFEFFNGASFAKPQIEALKEKAGIDLMNGVEIPDMKQKDAWKKISVKSKNEMIMQTIGSDAMSDNQLMFREKFLLNTRDITATNVCYGKIDIKRGGDLDFRAIDPRDAIYEEMENDFFILRSPVKGERRRMTIAEIIREYELTDVQQKKLNDMQGSAQSLISGNYGRRNPYSILNGQLLIDVIHIEWKSLKAWHTIEKPARAGFEETIPDDINIYNASRIVFPTEKEFNIEPESYNDPDKRAGIEKDIAKGKTSRVTTEWYDNKWEAVRIGHDMDVMCRPLQYQLRHNDNPSELYMDGGHYVGLIYDSIDGYKVSLADVCENISSIYNVAMYQVSKELQKYKGTFVAYNQAGQPKNVSISELLYDAVNDGVMYWNSSGIGNLSSTNLQIQNIIEKHDLGFSASFPSLIQLLADLKASLDQLTGINESREGYTKASSTATAGRDNIAASRSITEPMFYFIERYIDMVLMKYIELTKMSWVVNKLPKGEMILGSDKYGYLRVTEDIMKINPGVSIGNGAKEQKIQDLIFKYAEMSLNAKEVRYIDIVKAAAADSTAEAIAIIEAGWNKVEEIAQQQQAMANEQESKMSAQKADEQRKFYIEDREDKQAHQIQLAQIKGGMKIQENAYKAEDQANLKDVEQSLEPPMP